MQFVVCCVCATCAKSAQKQHINNDLVMRLELDQNEGTIRTLKIRIYQVNVRTKRHKIRHNKPHNENRISKYGEISSK